MADYDNDNGRYADEPRYERDRSASPRDEPRGDRARSRSPNGRPDDRDDRPGPLRKAHLQEEEEEEGSLNSGSNLFVTGIHPRLTESDITRLFEKYGDVENCSIMLDPHTKESRGFGFVNMVTAEQADAAKEGLQGEVIEGRTLSIEKARRNRPRTPTPGKYFGPPKRDGPGAPRGPPRRGDRYDDRRGPGGGGGAWRRRDDDYYRSGRYDSYNDRRESGRDYGRGDYRSRDYGGGGSGGGSGGGRDYRRDSRDDYSGYRGGGSSGGPDRYADRYSRDDRRGDDRRGGGEESRSSYYDRDANPPSYESAPPREPRAPYAGGEGAAAGAGSASGGRSYEGRGGEDRYASR
ncbi:hypothetical protein N7448_000659 [Penicillium atrosanguineum]|uniref:Uncharacterized protein n=1 Tax=Penicillium atrosanguineum TaxID=1132637 RepID=A0A9W9U890_9EURO|nr:uncharacterized protein N7443_004054 [Penicillium atrosanguineum]KAJ5134318.1 hypothetical protein N7526_005683 [Penicillium atrosanguineum]KAJ5149081.1 hypothetical protein N7448_000659 [Penicillium atrosanguineum]KAJ5304394.1 hypothetical protein N7443_004054 [Penicillium atrosanguineum]KAJ5323867.1 hypothetical protein N7476_002467 [Penicillium atrosanguineum]